MRAVIATSLDELVEHVPAWDALAVRCGLPYCAPAWMLAWWRALAPAGSELRVVLVLDGDRLAAVLPFHRAGPPARLRVWRHLCAGFCTRIGPVVAPGSEREAAAAAARAIAGPDAPDVLALEGLPAASPWPALLRDAWPGRLPPLLHRDLFMPAPAAVLDGGYEAWLARRRGGVRRDTLRRRRRLEEHGMTIRRAGSDELEAGVAALCRTYRARWDDRGGSDRLAPGLEAMLVAAGSELGDRFDLWLLERDGAVLAAHLFVAAGTELSAWGGGFEPECARYAPTVVLRLAAIERAATVGIARLEFGEGTQPDKVSFADEEIGVEWVTLLPRTRRYPLARARLLPKHARRRLLDAAHRLPPPLRERLRRIRRS
jgi:CelD/BcsL family acetyltransferase involved in cellulose biosynthesis